MRGFMSGAPTQVRNEIVENTFGATFDNQIIEWQLGRTQIKVIKYFDNINTSEIVIRNPALANELNRRKNEALRDKSGL
jgi:hypothetical protein